MSTFTFQRQQNNNKILFFLGCIILVLTSLHLCFFSVATTNDNDNSIMKGAYRGSQYWKQGATQSVRTLYETSFARFQVHTVLLEDGKTIVDDWMFFDEMDHIDVLVEEETKEGSSSYIVFNQSKYAIQGKSLAILGGLLDPGEDPQQAARRELMEELGMESSNWENLGSYRVAVNRGGGTTHTFLARKTRLISPSTGHRKGLFAEGESEKQKCVRLTREELVEALLAGKFQEIKWTATIALALLKMQQTGQ